MYKKLFFLFCFVLFTLVFSIFVTTPVKAEAYTFNNNLSSGVVHPDVLQLQKFLNTHSYAVATAGPGSSGLETTKFGPATKAALIKFQKSKNITPAIGYFGPVTRGIVNGLSSGGGSTTTLIPTSTNLPAGCEIGDLFSSITGLSCVVAPTGGTTAPTVTPATTTFPAGCTSALGFSLTTGYSCETGLPVVRGGGSSGVHRTQLTISDPTLTTSKVYNATTGAAVTAGTLTGVKSGDVVTVSAVATYDNKNTGTAKAITVVYSISGKDAGKYIKPENYVVHTGEITAFGIVGNFTTDASKIYDGSTSAVVNARNLTGVIGSDGVSLVIGTATYNNKNVGTDKVVTLTGAGLAGVDAFNYALTSVDTELADITQLDTTGSFTVAASKVYNSEVDVSTITQVVDNKITGDDVLLTGGTATYAIEDAEAGIAVSLVGATLTGIDAGNYHLTSVTNTSAEITHLAVVGDFTTNASKIYDGNNTADVLSRNLTGTIAGDDVQLASGFATYDDKNVGVNKIVTLTGAGFIGSDAHNYALSSVATELANITQLDTTGSFTVAASKTYDSDVDVDTTSQTVDGTIGEDVVVLLGGTATYISEHVGTEITVNLVGATLTGVDAGNYNLTSVTSTSADITQLQLTINNPTLTTSKQYDTNTGAVVTAGALIVGFIGGDAASINTTIANYDNKDVGTGKTITTVYTLAGDDAVNYAAPVDYVVTNGIITPIQLTISNPALTSSKQYDRTTTAAVTAGTLSGVLGADDVDVIATANYTDTNGENVGINKTITVVYSLEGDGAGNYIKPINYHTNAGIITQRQLTISHPSFPTDPKVYDGDNTATVTVGSLIGVISGETVTVSGVATYDDFNAGARNITTVYSIGGIDAPNYIKPTNDTDSGLITPLGIVGYFTTNATKVYDGGSTASVLTRGLTGVLPGDTVTLSGGTATYDNANVGIGKTVSLSGAGLAGDDAFNYALTSVDTELADITAIPLTVTAFTDTKVYDGGVTSDGVPTVTSGTLQGTDTIAGITQIFNTADVGSGKTLTPVGVVTDGNGGVNYALTLSPVTTGEITQQEITSFDAIGDVNGGTAGSAIYPNAAAVIAALNISKATVTANASAVSVPVATWVDFDTYDPLLAGSYTFTTTLGAIPPNFANTGLHIATVEVVIAP